MASGVTFAGVKDLPVEDITALAVDKDDQLWIGTSQVPCITDQTPRIVNGSIAQDDDTCRTTACWPWPAHRTALRTLPHPRESVVLPFVQTTLAEKARTIENRINERHRRCGLVAECNLNDAEHPTSHTIGDNDNDGLWTAYHVAAMSLCFGATQDPAAKASAQESMHALYMLQDASGTPGLVARSVVTLEEGQQKDAQWRPTPDGKMYWKSDTSSDEIDGHYLAFYTYWEHIAKNDDGGARSLHRASA